MRAQHLLPWAATLLVGCASYQVVPTTASVDDVLAAPAAGASKVCILRPQTRVLASTSVIHDNGQLVGATSGETFFCYAAQPGLHRITALADRQSNELLANPKPGETLYLRENVVSGTNGDETQINWGELSVDEARQDAARCRYVTLSQAGHESLPDPNAVVPATAPQMATASAQSPMAQ